MFYIGSYRENMKKDSCLKPSAKSLDIWFVASPNGPIPNLFKLCSWVQNWPRQAFTYFTYKPVGLYRENIKF